MLERTRPRRVLEAAIDFAQRSLGFVHDGPSDTACRLELIRNHATGRFNGSAGRTACRQQRLGDTSSGGPEHSPEVTGL